MTKSYEETLSHQLRLLKRLEPLMSEAADHSLSIGECEHLLGLEQADIKLLSERVEQRLSTARKSLRLRQRSRRQR